MEIWLNRSQVAGFWDGGRTWRVRFTPPAAGEYNMHNYGGLGLGFWKDLGRLIDEEDPCEPKERVIAHMDPARYVLVAIGCGRVRCYRHEQ